MALGTKTATVNRTSMERMRNMEAKTKLIAISAGLALLGITGASATRPADAGRHPSDPEVLAALGAAYMDRARATSDASWYARAEAAVDRALALDPGNYDASKIRAWVLTGQHRFAEAAISARKVAKLMPHDPFNYGTLGDALVEMGDYDGAAAAFQTMIDLRPDTASYARGAYLRELLGDTEGAMQLMTLAARSSDASNPDQRAWCLAQLGELTFSKGDLPGAREMFARALALSPYAAAARGGLARTLAAEDRYEEAADHYAKALTFLPSPALASEYANLLMRLGRDIEARRQIEMVQATEKLRRASGAVFDRQIALFRADHGVEPELGLAAAESELSARKDIYGYDAVAWCALAAGKIERAAEAMGPALRLGTRDAKLHYHAGMIAMAAGDLAGAHRHLTEALALNPHFDLRGADAAREALKKLGGR